MTKKDYIKIAQVLKETRASTGTMLKMAAMLKADNPRFDWDRFIEAVTKKEAAE